ncbi:alpha-hydroxy acid oxidase [Engelhardtia mirabilis]
MQALLNLRELERAAAASLAPEVWAYLQGGSDDMVTLGENVAAFGRRFLRPRRLVDVSAPDTSLELFGERLASPILLAPVGFQGIFHPEGELASARAAAARGQRMIVSTVSTYSVAEVVAASGQVPWFQLYTTPVRATTQALIGRAEDAGCQVLCLTVDAPVFGNRESHGTTLLELNASSRKGNLEGLDGASAVVDASLTWEFVDWLRERTRMRIVLKGIVTAEDATLARERGVDGLIVSNHGGRQLDRGRASIDCLAEVVSAVEGHMPVLLDGGIRRGTDAIMALALGAAAVCVGRPFVWGLAAGGQAGVERALEVLQAELVRGLQLVGAPTLDRLDASFVGPR